MVSTNGVLPADPRGGGFSISQYPPHNSFQSSPSPRLPACTTPPHLGLTSPHSSCLPFCRQRLHAVGVLQKQNLGPGSKTVSFNELVRWPYHHNTPRMPGLGPEPEARDGRHEGMEESDYRMGELVFSMTRSRDKLLAGKGRQKGEVRWRVGAGFGARGLD